MIVSALNTDLTTTSSGFLEKRDPRGKMVITVLLVITILTLHWEKPWQIAAVFVCLGILLILSKKSIGAYLKPLLKIIPMMLIISIVLPFRSFVPSEESWFSLFTLPIYKSGLLRFLELNIKFIFLVIGMLILLATTSIKHLLQSLESFRLPVWLSAILYYMVYFVFLLKDELYRQFMAYKSRSIYLPFWKRLRIIARMTAVYFIRLINRSERTTLAMISRGFYGRIYSHRKLFWETADSILLGITIFVLFSIKVWL